MPGADVDSLWCLYGLAGCSRPAGSLRQVVAQGLVAHEQRDGAQAARTVAPELAHVASAATQPEAPSVAALSDRAGQQDGLDPGELESQLENQMTAQAHALLPTTALEDPQPLGTTPVPTAPSGGYEASEPLSDDSAPPGSASPAENTISHDLQRGRNLAAAAATVATPLQAAARLIFQALSSWPLWVGSGMAAAALVQLMRHMPRRRLPITTVQQAASQQTAAPAPSCSAMDGSINGEAAAAGEQQVAPAVLSVTCPRPQPAASPDLSPLSSPTSPASPKVGPAPLSVDPTVRARDATKWAWVAVEAAPLNSSAGSGRRKSEFHNPLYHTKSSLPAEQVATAGEPARAHSGTSNLGGSAAEWQAKAAVAAAVGAPDAQDGEAADFRLLAAALPESAIAHPADWVGRGASSLPTAAHSLTAPGSAPSAAGRRSTSGDLPSPGSPGKGFRRAPRKLTAARSVGPQELPLAEGSHEAIAEGDEEA